MRQNLFSRINWFIPFNLIFAIVGVALTGRLTVASALQPQLNASIEDLSAFVGNEYWDLCSTQNQPCGLEELSCGDLRSDTPKGAKLVHIKKTTFRNALDEVSRAHPRYHWVVRNDVINIEPVHRTDVDLLSTKMSTVSFRGIPSDQAAFLAFKQAGVLLSNSRATTGPGGEAYPAINLDLKDVTLRDVLNAIATADGHMFWTFGPTSHLIPWRGPAEHCFSVDTWRRVKNTKVKPTANDLLKLQGPNLAK